MRFVRVSVLVLGILAPAVAGAQSLGAFRWQLQPYCNVVTVNVTREGGVYRLEGTDDLCGAGSAASAVGTAFVNPDASVGFGLTIVPAPNGSPVHIGATIQLSTLSGTWRDSAGHGGAFVPTPGAAAPGDPRPATTLGLSGVSLGFGLSQSGSPGDVSVGVDLDAVKSAIGLRQSLSGGLGLGDRALAEAGTDAYANTAVGNGALQSTSTGDFNTALGDGALRGNTTGRGNVAVGGFALRANIDGEDNTAVGVSALERSVINSGNTALGSGALFRLELGRNNIAIGQQAGFHLIAGSYNTYLGSTGANLDNYTVRIGYNDPGSRTFIAGIRGRTTAVANAVPVVIDSAGQLGTVSSSRRFKEDIADLGEVARGIQGLRPVRFRYTAPFANGARPVQYGLIAEEVEKVLPALVAYDTEGKPETVMYHVLPTLLVSEVQRLERERDTLTSRVEALERDLAQIRAELKGRR
ncbi:MAG: tail fiber domain-containing protein [Acidobacteria bacterium]|nr:tail fiber domain-containing protein [Acidobacteriota bacterium]